MTSNWVVKGIKDHIILFQDSDLIFGQLIFIIKIIYIDRIPNPSTNCSIITKIGIII